RAVRARRARARGTRLRTTAHRVAPREAAVARIGTRLDTIDRRRATRRARGRALVGALTGTRVTAAIAFTTRLGRREVGAARRLLLTRLHEVTRAPGRADGALIGARIGAFT